MKYKGKLIKGEPTIEIIEELLNKKGYPQVTAKPIFDYWVERKWLNIRGKRYANVEDAVMKYLHSRYFLAVHQKAESEKVMNEQKDKIIPIILRSANPKKPICRFVGQTRMESFS